MTDERKPRAADTREGAERKKQWINPSQLLDPEPRDGMTFRWIRSAILGQTDAKNLSAKKREGWEPVPATELPEFSDYRSETSGHIENGGLILCWMPDGMVAQRNAYYQKRADDQIKAVDSTLMRESDPRMPMSKPERHTSETFGTGKS